MAYNNLSGSVLLPEELLKIEGVNAGIVSGNLSTSDGADVINIPRVSNATDNSLVTNVGGDANTLTCETNLTFDGTTLGLVGEMSGSGVVTVANSISSSGDVAVSGSVHATSYYGDGSNLTGIAAGSVSGSQRVYSSTGLETSGYLKVSGSTFISGSVTHKRKFVNSDYSVSTTDYYIGVDTTANTVKLTLPTATTLLDGQTMVVKDEGGVANVNHITISGSASDTIDGQNQVVLESPFASIQLYCNGANKFFIC
tara:strand:- start:255 stop:1019 length:765 start_codon:yes stop_codon:yes gene_type:complete